MAFAGFRRVLGALSTFDRAKGVRAAGGRELTDAELREHKDRLLEIYDDFAERRALAANGAVFRVRRALGFLLAFASLRAWTRLWYGWNALCRARRGSQLVSCPVGRRHYFGELCPRDEMFGRRAGTFEGRTVPLPPGVERYLTRLYGADYMTPPPPERRERHVVYAASPSEGPA